MKKANQLFKEYSETHQNPLNQKIHLICVPLIFWSVFTLLWELPVPSVFAGTFLNWATIALIPVLIFYCVLGFRYFLIMLTVSLMCAVSVSVMQASNRNLTSIGLFIFFASWCGQFYGHKVEGKKPSFLTDILFLLIGPLWIYEKLLNRSRKTSGPE
jgi:uncharacterized membrane protein YGL010W